MKLQSDLSFGVVIAHLFPGSIFLWGILLFIDKSFNYSLIHCIIKGNQLFAAENQFIIVIGFLIAALISGLIIDGIRSSLPEKLFTREEKPKKIFPENKENFEVIKFLLENYYRYYQFYANISLALLLFSIAVFFYSPFPIWTFNKRLIFALTSLILTILLYIASSKAIKKFRRHVKQCLKE